MNQLLRRKKLNRVNRFHAGGISHADINQWNIMLLPLTNRIKNQQEPERLEMQVKAESILQHVLLIISVLGRMFAGHYT